MSLKQFPTVFESELDVISIALSGHIQTKIKILAVRDPLNRLYSAWNDKSRTFRFQNGSVDWELVKRTTPWAWGIENDKQAEKEMKDVLRHHDINFNPNNFGIGKFEEMMEFKLSSKILFEDSIICFIIHFIMNFDSHLP